MLEMMYAGPKTRQSAVSLISSDNDNCIGALKLYPKSTWHVLFASGPMSPGEDPLGGFLKLSTVRLQF